MLGREEIVGYQTEPVYAVKSKEYDDHGYPYWKVQSRWTSPEKASEAAGAGTQIVKQGFQYTSHGRVHIYDQLVVRNEQGEWVYEYDPRNSDPDWQTYLRLKEKFNE